MSRVFTPYGGVIRTQSASNTFASSLITLVIKNSDVAVSSDRIIIEF